MFNMTMIDSQVFEIASQQIMQSVHDRFINGIYMDLCVSFFILYLSSHYRRSMIHIRNKSIYQHHR